MINIYTNNWFKNLTLIIGFFLLMGAFALTTFASRDSAIEDYKQALIEAGFEGDAQAAAENKVDGVIQIMEDTQSAMDVKLEELKNREDSMHIKDTRKNAVASALNTAEGKVDTFKGFDASSNVIVESSIGTTPKVLPTQDFLDAEREASEALTAVNRELISPSRPGVVDGNENTGVPQGDILEDFIPQIVRQLFRFAWLAIFISFIVSGVYFIISFDNEERLSSAKRMIYFTLIGFAFVTLAFAIVKAITDIDFFGFI